MVQLNTENPREIPIHSELQRILAAWKLEGWPLLVSRHPKQDDFVVPRSGARAQHAKGEMHSHNSLDAKAVRRHASKLGINDAGRDFHPFRRAMIRLGLDLLADYRDRLERALAASAGAIVGTNR